MKNYIWNFINNVATRGLLFVFSLIVAKLLPPGEVGVFSAFMLLVAYLHLFFGWQLPAGIVAKLNFAGTSVERDAEFYAGLVLTVALGILCICAVGLGLSAVLKTFGLEESKSLSWLFVTLVVWRLLRDYFMRVMQADHDFRTTAMINVLGGIAQIGLAGLLGYLGLGLWGISLAVYISVVMVALVMGWRCINKHQTCRSWSQLATNAYRLMTFCGAIYVGSIAVFLATKIDSFFVNLYLSKEQLAIYTYSIEFALALTLIGDTISQVNYPRFARLFADGDNVAAASLYSRSLEATFFVVIILGLVLVLFAEWIIPFVLSPYYLALIPALTIQVGSVVLFAAFSSAGTLLTSRGTPLYEAIPVWISLAINVALNVLLVPQYGLVGAATATSVSFLLRTIMGTILIERVVKPGHNYVKLIAIYGLFVSALVVGSIVTMTVGQRFVVLGLFVGIGVLNNRHGIRAFWRDRLAEQRGCVRVP